MQCSCRIAVIILRGSSKHLDVSRMQEICLSWGRGSKFLVTVQHTLLSAGSLTCRDYTWSCEEALCHLALEVEYKPVVLGESNSWFIIGKCNDPFFFSEKLQTKEVPTFYMRSSQSESFDKVPVLNTFVGTSFYPQDPFFFLWKKWKANNNKRFSSEKDMSTS